MLHINKPNSKYANLYRLVLNIYQASTERTLDYSLGVYCGWTNAKLLYEWTVQEIGNVDKLVDNIEAVKREQFKEG